jgi:glycosyltransferase involved in cell wall biosynthesis
MKAAAIVMVKNEEHYIWQVLSYVAQVMPVYVGDTGSTDSTIATIKKVMRDRKNVTLFEMGPQTKQQLVTVREDLGGFARLKGYEWGFLIDGDELYYPRALRAVLDEGMPKGKRLGFVSNVTVDNRDGFIWAMDDIFSRTLVYPLTDRWVVTDGPEEYPWECPESFMHKGEFHYFRMPGDLIAHGLHLHRLTRSRMDGEVMRRMEKQRQFGMVDKQVGWLGPLREWPQ